MPRASAIASLVELVLLQLGSRPTFDTRWRLTRKSYCVQVALFQRPKQNSLLDTLPLKFAQYVQDSYEGLPRNCRLVTDHELACLPLLWWQQAIFEKRTGNVHNPGSFLPLNVCSPPQPSHRPLQLGRSSHGKPSQSFIHLSAPVTHQFVFLCADVFRFAVTTFFLTSSS